ncbi:Glutathione S-transferase omega-like protein [Emericellopsis cladophorae]|uniref:Glutathione S-transferase omega-like protein n=1 Tax=Emericellopsis cladophorae TaxID=2686198 RepID=A0A9Q0BBA1_9HYPO|nr:Glutathione S-transferase omega-like protein [Emericellopsis cladophorae]KAI6778280.1 Glutathione S-transferase omega-like protein [Emericellopsis cladophorae]
MATVDTSLPAEPTGAAAALAEAHAQPHALKLYGGWFCPYVQRAWITLVEKAISHQYIEINPYNKDPSFLALNPRGLVPTLAVSVGDGEKKPLYESTVVCEYLDEQFDSEQNGERLLSGGPYERARARLWIDHITGKIIPGFYKLLQHTPNKAYSLDDARAELHKNIRSFVNEMATEGPWFLGHTFSMVDIMLAPWAKRLWLIDHYKTGGTGVPESGEGDETWDRWNAWFDAIVERPSVKATWSADERYMLAYKRYAEDTTNSEVAQATREGRRLP